MFSSDQTQVSAAGSTDPYFNYVTALLHGDGTNGGQNNTFTDSSTNNFTITRNGNTTQGSWNPFGTLWSNYFNGTNSYLTMGSSAPMNFGLNNFTIECWVNTSVKSISGGASRTVIGNSGNSYTMQLYIDTTSARATFGNTGSTFLQGTTSLDDGKWHHIAVSRSGTSTNQIALFVDGVREAVGTNALNYASSTIYIGAFDNAGNGYWSGYVSNLRIVNGTSLYSPSSSTITVPTSQLTAVANTSLLICQSNRFVDNSGNAVSNTVNGTPSVQNFVPFLPTAAYSTSVNGGSGYFDGTGDWLNAGAQTAYDFGTGDFTIETYIYGSGSNWAGGDASGYTCICDTRLQSNSPESNRLFVGINNTGSYPYFYDGSTLTATNSSIPVSVGCWNHIAVTRASGVIKIWVNGVQGASFSNTTSFTVGRLGIGAGAAVGGTINDRFGLIGYLNGFRWVKGTAVYTTTFTPPSAPLTAISGTSLLLNMVNGAIFDNAYKNDFETVGNAQISTSVKKFGTGSMYFDGSGDYLYVPSNPANALGTGDFTVECWVNAAATPSDVGIFESRTLSDSGIQNGFTLTAFSSSVIRIFSDGVLISSSGTSYVGTWCYVAVVRASGTWTLYINGVSQGTSTASRNMTNTDMVIGAGRYTSSSSPSAFFNGYIDDFRISRYARYTANFTPPTAAFPNQ